MLTSRTKAAALLSLVEQLNPLLALTLPLCRSHVACRIALMSILACIINACQPGPLRSSRDIRQGRLPLLVQLHDLAVSFPQTCRPLHSVLTGRDRTGSSAFAGGVTSCGMMANRAVTRHKPRMPSRCPYAIAAPASVGATVRLTAMAVSLRPSTLPSCPGGASCREEKHNQQSCHRQQKEEKKREFGSRKGI